MKKLITICLILCLLTTVVSGRKISQTFDRLGNFTGPEAGTAQDDNVKASLDLLHAKVNAAGTGSAFYVDSGVTTEGDGSSWSNARDTLQEAIDLCTANSGDVIYVAQAHAENIATAAAIDCDCAGITIIGMGTGADRPAFSLTANASTFAITDPDVTLVNLRFLGAKTSGGSAQCVDIGAAGDGATLLGCEFRETSNDTELVIMVSITADADDCVFIGNRFIGETGGGDAIAIDIEDGSDRTVIEGNYFYGDWSGYVIDASDSTPAYNVLVKDNVIHNFDTSAGKTIAFDASSTGDIVGNVCYGNGASFAIVGDTMFVSPDNIVMQTENTEVRTFESMFGGFSGDGGVGQGDSIYADFVLAQTDLDAILADTITISGSTLPAAPVSGSLATYISGGSATLGQPLPASMSLVDIIGNFTGDYNDGEQDDNIKASLDLAHTDLDAIIEDTVQLDVDVNDIEDYVDMLDTDVNDIEETMALDADVNDIEELITQLDVDVNDIEEYVDMAEHDINDVEEALAQVNIDINDIEEYVDMVENDVNDVEDALAQVDVDINDIETDTAAILVDTGTTLPATLASMEMAIEKSDGSVPNGDDALFTITGGPILVHYFAGIVTEVIDSNAVTCTIEIDVTEPAGTVALSTAVAITDDAAGTSYTFTDASPSVLTPTTAGALDQLPLNRWFCPVGSIVAKMSAANLTGTIKWYMVYKPLSPNSVVVAAP